jgi:hypothetical protein
MRSETLVGGVALSRLSYAILRGPANRIAGLWLHEPNR